MKILSFILKTILVLVIASVATLVLAAKIPATHLEIKIVKSGSMEPVVKTGSVVIIRPADEYPVGDIITFGADTKQAVPTTHRIVSVREESGIKYYTTKGDANEDVDAGETPGSKIIGHVLMTVPYVGYTLAFAKQPLGFALMIVVPAALIILYEVIGIVKEMRRLKKKSKTKLNETLRSEPVDYTDIQTSHERVSYDMPAARSMGRF